MSINIKTPQDVQQDIADRFRQRRLARSLTQEGLAARSGVSWGSLKRFERTGLIALDSLLKIALVLDCLEDFDGVCVNNNHDLSSQSLDAILNAPKPRKKGRLK